MKEGLKMKDILQLIVFLLFQGSRYTELLSENYRGGGIKR